MIQLLVSLIEWFAVMGLSLLGIAYDPLRPCPASEPTEFRQAVVWIPGDAFERPQASTISSGDCIAGTEVLIHGAKPSMHAPSDRYDS